VRRDRVNSWKVASATLAAWMLSGAHATPQTALSKSKTPIVLIVGCARETDQPHLWTLSNAGERSESSRVAITIEEKEQLARRPLGGDTYQLIGVADFVDADTSRRIGVRGEILAPSRVNATGVLASGHRVAVKGLYIEGVPARINLTSVVDLGSRCP
jgi:hypothetical protein